MVVMVRVEAVMVEMLATAAAHTEAVVAVPESVAAMVTVT